MPQVLTDSVRSKEKEMIDKQEIRKERLKLKWLGRRGSTADVEMQESQIEREQKTLIDQTI